MNIEKFVNPTLKAISDNWEKKNEEGHRAHLGASLIGEECPRKLWYVFRHCKKPEFPGRMYRLFDRGQREEEVFVKELRDAGVTIHDVDSEGNQLRISDIGGHFAGSLDGMIHGGLKESSKPHVAEFKTYNEKTFKQLLKDAVKKAKPLHYAQMQVYMHYTDVDRALYMAVNKNDDTVYMERVKYDKDFALSLIEKAQYVIDSKQPPPKLTNSKSDWRCKFCNFKDICHGHEVAEVNCRTCLRSTPVTTGSDRKWTCDMWGDIPDTACGSECANHLYVPGILPRCEAFESDGSTYVKYVDDDEVEVVNGNGGISSQQMYEMKNVT